MAEIGVSVAPTAIVIETTGREYSCWNLSTGVFFVSNFWSLVYEKKNSW